MSVISVLMQHSVAVPAALAVGLGVGFLIGRKAPRYVRSSSGGGSRDADGVELYVGNLPSEMEEPALRKEFERFGGILSVRVVAGRFQGRSKRFGFVVMLNRREAEAAIQAMHGRELLGRQLVVNEARNPRRSSGRRD
ncbi:MAG: hypothetical protein WCL16_04535 [bacterium]